MASKLLAWIEEHHPEAGPPPWVEEPPHDAAGVAGVASALQEGLSQGSFGRKPRNKAELWITIFETLVDDGVIEIPEHD